MSNRRIRRRRFERVVVWQPATGSIINLPSRYILSNDGPSESEEYAQLASGSKTPVRRTNSVQIPVTHKELGLFTEIIQRSSCPVEAAFISSDDYDNWIWNEPTRLQVTDPEVESGQLAEKVIELENNVFFPGIWESTDLIGGVPWQGTKGKVAEEIDGTPIRLEPEGQFRKGYTGPGWEGTKETDSVDLAGEASLNSDATLEFNFPVWGATLQIETLLGFSLGNIVVNALNFNKSVLKSVSASQDTEITLPDETWSIEVSVASSTARPKITVKDVGRKEGVVYAGKVAPNCGRVDDPDYEELPKPNEPPQWEQKEDLVWGKNNNAPTFTKCDDYTVTKEFTGGDNSPPNFTTCENFTVVGTLTEGPKGSGYTPPSTIQATSAIYTSEGGFAKIDWPGLTKTNIKDDIADAELNIDENAGYVFVATDNGINRYDLSGGNETTNIVGNDPDGVAVDQLTQTLYFTEAGITGIWTSDYSGNNKTKIADPPGISNSIAVAPDGGNGGFIFVASFDAQEIYRLDLSGSNKKTIADYTNRDATTYSNVHLHLGEALVFWQQSADSTTRRIVRADFSGKNEGGIFVQRSSVNIFRIFEWTILEDEKKWVQVERAENGFSEVETRNLDGSGYNNDSISDLDSGSHIASAQKMSN